MNASSELLTKHPRRMTPEELATAIEANKPLILGYLDEQFSRSVVQEMAVFLNLFFRPTYIGFEELPERNDPKTPLIYVGNHSGMAFPWDAIVFGTGLMEMHDFDMQKVFRPLAAPMLSASKLMNPYLLEDIWKRVGAIDATSLNFETMMNQAASNLLLYPEGVPGIGKGFNRKYQLQTFSTSVVRMALKYRTDIVSAFCVNGEYINPYAYSSRRLNLLFNKIGIPFMPIGILTILMIFQPWLFYAAMPAKLTYVRGDRYSIYDWIDKPFEEITMAEFREIRDQLQAKMQQELDTAVKEYGKKPFRPRGVFPNSREKYSPFSLLHAHRLACPIHRIQPPIFQEKHSPKRHHQRMVPLSENPVAQSYCDRLFHPSCRLDSDYG